jgi:hypothetical protein
MVPSLNLYEGIASSGFCHVRKAGQIGAFNEDSDLSSHRPRRRTPVVYFDRLGAWFSKRKF